MDGKVGVVGGQNEFARRACKTIVRIIAELAGHAEDVAREFEEASRLLAERSSASVEEAAGAILNTLQRNECGAKETIEAINNLAEELQVRVKRKGNLGPHTKRKKQIAAERATAHHFRQYKGRENTWGTKKRTGKRWREWRGPWKDN